MVWLRCLGILLLCLTLLGCGESEDPSRPNTFTPLSDMEIAAPLTTLAAGTSSPLSVLGNFSGLFTRDVTREVLWSSLDETVATVSRTFPTQGRVTAVSPGIATIRVEKDGIVAEVQITVSDAEIAALALGPPEPSVARGLRLQLEAQGTFSDGSSQDVTFDVLWESLAPQIATVSNDPASKGQVSGVTSGVAEIQATFGLLSQVLAVTVSEAQLQALQVRPDNTTLANLSLVPYTAQGTFSDGVPRDLTGDVVWSSSIPSVAQVSNASDNKGRVTTLATGTTIISASLGGISAGSTLGVVGAAPTTLSLAPAQPLVADGTSLQITATASGLNLTALATWSSNNTAVATVSNLKGQRGVVSALSPGTAQITATLGSLSQTVLLSVSSAQLVNLAILPAEVVIPRSTSLMLQVTGLFSDGTSQNLTRDAIWSSSSAEIARVENSVPEKGRVEGLAVGSAQVTASFATLNAQQSVTVTENLLVSLGITPGSATVRAGRSLAFTAVGTFADNSTRDLTRDVTWSVSDAERAAISNSAGSRGELTALRIGTLSVRAEHNSIQAEVPVTVVNP